MGYGIEDLCEKYKSAFVNDTVERTQTYNECLSRLKCWKILVKDSTYTDLLEPKR